MLFPRFKRFVLDHALLGGGDGVVVAVSGGPDSMAMLDFFARLASPLGLRLVVAHVNHGLRGKASDEDACFVREVARRLGWPCKIVRRKPADKGNCQDAARKLRYAFLQEVAERHGARLVATAHHADDQAETLLLHLIRGSGLAGLSGMRPSSRLGEAILIRPLLFATRREIEAYVRERGIGVRIDASNAAVTYARNRLRHGVMLLLRKENPRIVEALAATAERLAREDEALDLVAKALLEDALVGEVADGVALDRRAYAGSPAALRARVLLLAFERASGSRAGLGADHLRRMDEISLGNKVRGRYHLPASATFFRERDLLLIRQGAPSRAGEA